MNTQVLGVNSRGDVVGTYFLQGSHGFLLRNGSFSTIDFPGAQSTVAPGASTPLELANASSRPPPGGASTATAAVISTDRSKADTAAESPIFPGSLLSG